MVFDYPILHPEVDSPSWTRQLEIKIFSQLSLNRIFSQVKLLKVAFIISHIVLTTFSLKADQTSCFNHQSLDFTLADFLKSEPTVSPDKPMGQL